VTMAFTPFVDDLALIEVFLLLVASVLAYSGIRVWLAMRSNQPDMLRKVLHGTAIPIGLVGAATFILALWGEMTWPFLTSDGMGGYNIFFFDPMLLLSFVLIAFAFSAYLSLRLEYVGVFALVAGGAVIFYGWTGYTASPPFTKDPFYTLLLYLGFGVAGLLALPASVIVDYYTTSVERGRTPWQVALSAASPRSRSRSWGVRAAQPTVPRVFAGSAATEQPPAEETAFRMPKILQALVLMFPVIIALAGIAAFWYFGVTLPGHLGNGPSAAP